MKLFILSASVFYLLGLKLTTNIEVKPAFQHKTDSTELKEIHEKLELRAKPIFEIPKKESSGQTKTDSVCKISVSNNKLKQVTGI